jgi:SAM-dependent MidA family methyltransferase
VSDATPLARELARLIAADGPIPVADYMALCLGHPRYGYYRTRDPLGGAGDFVTAPEVSQMFGELIGLWAVDVWQRMGAPGRFVLAELGPGRGTLMADALRAVRIVPGFRAALELHLVEIGPVLRARQRETLAASDIAPAWHDHVATLPEAPLIVIANEFFDALPVHQAVKAADGWHARRVGLDTAGDLVFALDPAPLPGFAALLPAHLAAAPEGAVFEWRADSVVAELCRRLVGHGGAALVIDYGHAASALGDTLQAVRGHAYADPLQAPGEADLTAHVDFAALAAAAERAGAAVLGPLTQGVFLRALGIEQRAAKLKAAAGAEQRAAIDAALARLSGSGRDEMGELFKVLVLADPRLGLAGPFG